MARTLALSSVRPLTISRTFLRTSSSTSNCSRARPQYQAPTASQVLKVETCTCGSTSAHDGMFGSDCSGATSVAAQR